MMRKILVDRQDEQKEVEKDDLEDRKHKDSNSRDDETKVQMQEQILSLQRKLKETEDTLSGKREELLHNRKTDLLMS